MKKLKYQLEHSTRTSKTGWKIIIFTFTILSIAFVTFITLASSKVESPNVQGALMVCYTFATIPPFALTLRMTQYTIEMICIQHTYIIHLWAPKQNSQSLTISKSSVITDILSDNYEFAGYAYEHIENTNEYKTLISIPITSDEFDKIYEHIKDCENQKRRYMNPDITVDI